MTRRNLRKWAEAKQRRAEQVEPEGYWLHGSGLRPIFIEYPWPLYGTYVAPTRWIPFCDEPPYPSRALRDQIWAEAQIPPSSASGWTAGFGGL